MSVLNGTGMDNKAHQQTQGIDQDMTLASG